MGNKVVQSEDGADESPQSARHIYNQQYRETNLNFGPQMRFPPTEQIQALEANCPGFTERFVAMMQREAAHRQGIENKYLEGRNAIAMKDLQMEDGRIKILILPIAFVLLLFATAAIVFFYRGNNNAGFALSGLFAIPSIAALVRSVKNTRKN